MSLIKAYGAAHKSADLKPLNIQRRDVLDNDIKIKITYCGVCHSDIHVVDNDWGKSLYPAVPGHEIIGKVVSTGKKVCQFKKGDLVGVGCLVDSCRTCNACKDNLEQYCENGVVGTYNGPNKHLGGHNFGGYSEMIVVNEDFVLKIPENLDEKAVAPLLCAGITTYSPLMHWKVKKGDKVGIIGLGGLGHMGIKFASALGAHVVMITTSPKKAKDAKKLGADEVLISKDKIALEAHLGTFDFLLNTVPVRHNINPYIQLLKRDATMVMVGAIEPIEPVNSGLLVLGRKNVAGSLIGGLKETQEMLDFCGKHNIVSEVEMIKIKDINDAYTRIKKADVKYRFVIDMESIQ